MEEVKFPMTDEDFIKFFRSVYEFCYSVSPEVSRELLNRILALLGGTNPEEVSE